MARKSLVNQYVRITMPMSARLQAEIDGRIVSFSILEHKFLETLLLRGPTWSTVEELIELMWPNPDTQPDTAEVIVKVWVHRLRERSVRITSKPGRLRAYRIAQPGDVARHKRQIPPHRDRKYATNPPEYLLGMPFKRRLPRS